MEGQEKDRSPVRRRRSTSESGTDVRLSSTLDEFGIPPRSLIESNIQLEPRSRSSQNLSTLRGSYYESPLGQGAGTRTILDTRTSTADGVRAEILAKFNALKQRTDLWENQLSEQELSKVGSDLIANHLLEAITKLSSEAVCSRSDRRTSSEIKNLKDRIARTARFAEREFRSEQQNRKEDENGVESIPQDSNRVVLRPDILQARVEPELQESSLIDLSDNQIEDDDQYNPTVTLIPTSATSLSIQEKSVLDNLVRLREDPVRGFIIPTENIENIESVSAELRDQYKNIDERIGKLEFTSLATNVRVSRLENKALNMEKDILTLKSSIDSNRMNVATLDNKISGLSQDWNIRTENIARKIADFEKTKNQAFSAIQEENLKSRIMQDLQKMVTDNASTQAVKELRENILEIRNDIVIDQNVTDNLRDLVIELKEQVNASMEASTQSNQKNYQPPGNSIVDIIKSARECEIIKHSIERSSGLIRQLIATDLDKDNLIFP